MLACRVGLIIAPAILLLQEPASSAAQPAVRQVLMLQSVARGNMILDHFTGNFRIDLEKRFDSPVNVIEIVVGPTGQIGASEPAVVEYIRSAFAGRPQPDLIVTMAGPAAVFARKYRQHLFPDAPILFASVDERYLRGAPLGDNETAVTVALDVPRLMDDLLQILPQTREVFMIIGSGALGKFWRGQLEADFRRFENRLAFSWSDDLSLSEVLNRSASLPRNSAIFYLTFGADAIGGAYADERVLAELRATSKAPVFAAHSVYLNHGVVGGTMTSVDDLSRSTADVAIRILNGERPQRIRVPPQLPAPPVFDWRELQKWGIDERRLPAGSVVVRRAPNLWREYRGTVFTTAAALIVQALLIAGLLYQRRARQRAEVESRRNLALATDAGRRQTMSALTNSITHELGQPLSAMIHNAQALQKMIGANRASGDTIGEIVSDIQTQGVQATQIIDRHRAMLRSHVLEKKPIDIRGVIQASLALVASDLKARHIDTRVDVPSEACIVTGDPVLLQQVLVNLLINAADAMAETPPAGRRLTIRTAVGEDSVEISVSDAGGGLPAQFDGRLFAPFVTTKPHGLGIGLTIVRTILDAHGGAIDARNNPDVGATFMIMLPSGETPSPIAASKGSA